MSVKIATRDFHSMKDIPDGAVLRVEATNVTGNVQGDTAFMSGVPRIPDALWTLDDMENGNAQADLGGPALSMVRSTLALAAQSTVQIDMLLEHGGEEIRRTTWRLDAGNDNRAVRLGLVISVLGGAQ